MAEKAGFDGRFGENFDDELNPRGVTEVTIGIAVACALGLIITWFFVRVLVGRLEATSPTPSPVAEAAEGRLPEGPLLQADPEGELLELRREMAARLHGYGWVDEGQGIVHIPIEAAIDLVAERGLAGGSSEMESEAMGEAQE